MEIIKIDKDRVKLYLSAKDLADKGINLKDLECDEKRAKEVIFELISCAKLEKNVKNGQNELDICAFSSKDGGCELFIKRVNGNIGGEFVGYTKESIKISTEKSEKKYTYSFVFDSIDLMARACGQLFKTRFSGESEAYFKDGNDGVKYYMILSGTHRAQQAKTMRPLSFLSEFGERCCGELSTAYIREHCNCICRENAVDVIYKSC